MDAARLCRQRLIIEAARSVTVSMTLCAVAPQFRGDFTETLGAWIAVGHNSDCPLGLRLHVLLCICQSPAKTQRAVRPQHQSVRRLPACEVGHFDKLQIRIQRGRNLAGNRKKISMQKDTVYQGNRWITRLLCIG